MSFYWAVSTVADGTMSGEPKEEARRNRRRFLTQHHIEPEKSVLVWLTYGGNDYCRYGEVTEKSAGDGMVRAALEPYDAVFTTRRNVALFLPLADCIGAVIYDPRLGVVGLSHLGRHNLEQQGGRRTIEFMQQRFGSAPDELTVHLSPAAGKENYPLFAFEHRSLHEVALEQLTAAGVNSHSIRTSSADTTVDSNYFSHSQYLRGGQLTDGRHAVVAVRR